jgi:site-specific recombinase XerD
MANTVRHFMAGEKQCSFCSADLPAFTGNLQKVYACSELGCRDQYRKALTYRRRMKEIKAGEVQCQAPGCNNTVPPGLYMVRKTRFFCDTTCAHKFYESRNVVGECLYCGGEIRDIASKKDRLYCTVEHERKYFTEIVFAQKAGPFFDVLKEYLEGAAKNNYKPSTWEGARTNLLNFCAFLQKKGVSDLRSVRPRTITGYIRAERDRGLKSDNYIGHISAMFKWLEAEERVAHNPVIPSIHKAKRSECSPRPLLDGEIERYWTLLVEDADVLLRAALAIGEECGLRIGEVCNLRLSDVDLASLVIKVRTPNKNDRPREVPCSDKTVKYVTEWLHQRNPACPTDHLFHNGSLRPYLTSTLGTLFKSHLAMRNGGPVPFSYHRMRHSWATRLCNAGIEPAVLMELGGWRSWEAMKHYIKMLKSTIDASYRNALENMRRTKENEQERSYSLVAFANMNPPTTAPTAPAAAPQN